MEGMARANVDAFCDATGDSDDEFFSLFILPELNAQRKRKHGGSEVGRRAGKERKRAQYGEEMIADYFCDNPTYDASTLIS